MHMPRAIRSGLWGRREDLQQCLQSRLPRSKVDPGQCVESCICTAEFEPVCGEDGTTYSNACEAGCQGVKSTPGPCVVGCDTCPGGFNDGCNNCACSSSGLAACTAIACATKGEPACLENDETASSNLR